VPALAVLLLLASGLSPSISPPPDLSGVPRATARRVELVETLVAAGSVESSAHTLLRCQMENIPGRHSSGSRPGSTTILSLAPEGASVRAGDVLCRLDSSEHEEIARLQKITVARVRALHRRAQLDLETAEIALREYADGLCALRKRGFEGEIALASAQRVQFEDRLAWTRRMFAKGYVSRSRVAGDAAALQRAEFNLERIRGEFGMFTSFEVHRTRRELECAVESARTGLVFQAQSLRAEEARLADLERQIAQAVIRAPHDGQVVLVHKPKRGVKIEEGLWVRQNQPLIYLPDSTRLEVSVRFHETVLDRVRPEHRVRVKLEGSDRVVLGELVSIDALPVMERNSRVGQEVKYYLGQVSLDEVPGQLRLGMTAEVTVETAVRSEALVVPPGAIGGGAGGHFCLVATPHGLARRPVVLGLATPLQQEVTRGLEEGEEVVLIGAGYHAHPPMVSAALGFAIKTLETGQY
jgi:multidrug resistance efflux pump